MRRGLFSLGVVLVLSSCGGNSVSTSTTGATTTPASPSPTSTTSAASTATEASTTTTVASTTTTAVTYEVVIEGGTDEIPEVTVTGPGRFQYRLGDTVEITILSSVDDEIHVHGYNLFFDLVSGAETVLTFEATIPGIFEVEMEDRHKLVFELEVTQ